MCLNGHNQKSCRAKRHNVTCYFSISSHYTLLLMWMCLCIHTGKKRLINCFCKRKWGDWTRVKREKLLSHAQFKGFCWRGRLFVFATFSPQGSSTFKSWLQQKKRKEEMPHRGRITKKSLIYKSVLWLWDQSRIRSGCLWIRKSGLIEKHKREPEFAIFFTKVFLLHGFSLTIIWGTVWLIYMQAARENPGPPHGTLRHLTAPCKSSHHLTSPYVFLWPHAKLQGTTRHLMAPNDSS